MKKMIMLMGGALLSLLASPTYAAIGVAQILATSTNTTPAGTVSC